MTRSDKDKLLKYIDNLEDKEGCKLKIDDIMSDFQYDYIDGNLIPKFGGIQIVVTNINYKGND